MSSDILATGNRKNAKATARLVKGSGKVIVNKKPIDLCSSTMYVLRMKEPLLLAGDIASKIDLFITTKGGGFASQADAVRLAVARALVEFKSDLEEVFSDYDRTLLVADVRRREPRKPNTSGRARAKRQKSYR